MRSPLCSLLLLLAGSSTAAAQEPPTDRGTYLYTILQEDTGPDTSVTEYTYFSKNENNSTQLQSSTKPGVITIAYKSAEISCAPAGSTTNVTLGFRVYVGSGYSGDINSPSAVVKNLFLTYDFGEFSYGYAVADSEAPVVGNYDTAEWYTWTRGYAYKKSSIFHTKFGWEFEIEDPAISFAPFPSSSSESALMYIGEDECEYGIETPEPTMSMTPTSSPTIPSAAHGRMGGNEAPTYLVMCTMVLAFAMSFIG